MTISFRHRHGILEGSGIEDSDQRAYTLIEAARIRCEQLAPMSKASEALRSIHRDLGLAGYYCSTELAAATRRRCLARAREAYANVALRELCDELSAIWEQALSAAEALSDALADCASDHMHLAHVHLMEASVSLDDYLGDLQATP